MAHNYLPVSVYVRSLKSSWTRGWLAVGPSGYPQSLEVSMHISVPMRVALLSQYSSVRTSVRTWESVSFIATFSLVYE